MWFEDLVGFRERDGADVRARLVTDGEYLTSKVNGRRLRAGRFETPTLRELRRRSRAETGTPGTLRLSEIVADAAQLHAEPENAGATFQVASQFNTLEMVAPDVPPERGISGYENDKTQGPACAIACGAGTIQRAYLVTHDGSKVVDDGSGSKGHVGQTAANQLNLFADLGAVLRTDIEVRNGYALPTAAQLAELNERIIGLDEQDRDELMAELRIGIQWDTEVTLGRPAHTVTQAYCSALPVAYLQSGPRQRDSLEPLARLVLDGAYEATVRAALLNATVTGNPRVYLTLLGGGAFGNPVPWILDAVERVVTTHAKAELDIAIVSHRSPNPDLEPLLAPGSSWADEIFEDRPDQWGLRGDPYLWDELHVALRREPEPGDRAGFEGLINAAVTRLIGVDLALAVDRPDPTRVVVTRYRTPGMSGGAVVPEVWRDRLVPRLLDRFDEAHGAVGR